MEKLLFKEEQRFNQWWLWLIMIIALLSVLVPFAWGLYSQVVFNEPSGETPMSKDGLIVTGVFSVLLLVFVFFVVFGSKLKTKITHEGIFIAYPPFFRKWRKYTPAQIDNYELRTFKANREFGGRGMRKRRKNGQAFIITGNVGLQLFLKDGQKLLIGTQKKQAIEYAMGKILTGKKHVSSAVGDAKKTKPVFGKKARKILIILTIEIIVAILIFVFIQIFK